MSNKGVMVVSFGTSYPETRERTIGAIERRIREAFPDRVFYSAWTSRFLIRKVREKEGLDIADIEEAMATAAADGVTDLIVQPTQMLRGEEYAKVTDAVNKSGIDPESVRIGKPLLADERDLSEMVGILSGLSPDPSGGTVMVWMGHGSPAGSGVYIRLEGLLHDAGYTNNVIGTVEYEPGFRPVQEYMDRRRPERAVIAPMLVVAGEHAINDMAGVSADSWKSRLEALGISTECVIRGLGEYREVQDMYVRHAREAAGEDRYSIGE